MSVYSSYKKHDPDILISAVARGFRCIRQYYFDKSREWNETSRYSICKQVSCAEYENRNEDEIWNLVVLVEPGIDPQLRNFLRRCFENTRNTPLRPWTDLDVAVRSDKLGIRGILDKYHSQNRECTLVRCSDAPKTGCWPDDRIRVTALLFATEESLHCRIDGVYVEYIPSGIVRFCEPGPKDRRTLLRVIAQIKMVDNGEFPGKPLKAPCSRCRYLEKCNTGEPVQLSDLFKKRE